LLIVVRQQLTVVPNNLFEIFAKKSSQNYSAPYALYLLSGVSADGMRIQQVKFVK